MANSIVVESLARVEGHGGITVEIRDNKVSKVNFDIFEGARFFEALIVGRSYTDVSSVVSRICAICSSGHTLTSQLATEDAFGVKVSRQTKLLRDLLMQGESIESHALHLYALALPDFLNYPSAIALAKDNPGAVVMGLRLKKLGNTVQEVVGGRAVHPCNPVVGGFGKIPSSDELIELRKQLEKGLKDALKTIDIISTIGIPDFPESPTVYAALDSVDNKYGFFGNTILISTGESIPVKDYRKLTNERVVSHSHAKHSQYKEKSVMVGALARLILNEKKLTGEAKSSMEKLGFKLPSNNILHNNVAQAIELVYSIERARELIDEILDNGLKYEKPVEFEVRSGCGTAAIEVPRGTLYHSYSYDENGKIVEADVITPTAINLANAEKDFRASVEKLKKEPKDSLAFKLEMVARAYDPCISCSVHVVELK